MAVAANILDEFSEIAVCSICTDEFKNPRMLTCRHTFCLPCLEQYRSQRYRVGNVIECPLCRQECAIPVGGLVNFEKNLDIERLLETSKRVESKLKEGTFICLSHAGKAVVLFCKTCLQLVCPSCIIGSHSQHQFDEMEGAAACLSDKLRARLGCSVKEGFEQLNQNISGASRTHSRYQSMLAAVEDEVINHYNSLINLVEEDFKSLDAELKSLPSNILVQKTNMVALAGKLELLLKLCPDGDVKSCCQPLELIPLCTELLSMPLEELMCDKFSNIATFTFEPNQKLHKLQSKAVNVLGVVCQNVSLMTSGGNGRQLVPLHGCPYSVQKQSGWKLSEQSSSSDSANGGSSSQLAVQSMFGEPAVNDQHYEEAKPQDTCASWCCCDYCEPMVDLTERRCCATWRTILTRCELAEVACVTQLPGFRANCLNIHVLQTAFYEEYASPRTTLEKSIHEIYRDLACVRFRRWMYRVPKGHVTNGVPACALDIIRRTFPPEDSCHITYPR